MPRMAREDTNTDLTGLARNIGLKHREWRRTRPRDGLLTTQSNEQAFRDSWLCTCVEGAFENGSVTSHAP